ncbi:MAG: calcium-binding protein [Cyanobacteria bacterium SID2]|nr:calcium-binding protein [Cyanobacteria bacterium SID2]MBP0005379.1 calcium-binding protein [Cyanobacteria bacterium SBC]
MSRVTNETQPVSSTENSDGGLDIQGTTEQSNRLNGGSGNDLITTEDPASGGTAGEADWVDAAGGDDIVAGYAGDDSLLGDSGNDILSGNQGDDSLLGEAGEDVVFGGQGNDVIEGGAGNDVLSGDLGDDVVRGGDGNDIALGGAGNDTVEGGAGNDIVAGGEGSDVVEGSVGDDSAFGGQGNDVLEGGEGSDWLAGDLGADSLSGGEGNDTFVYSGYGNPGVTADSLGGDTITDFVSGEDKIALDKTIFSELGDTLESAEFVKVDSNVPGVGESSSIKLIYNTTTGELIYNPTEAADDEVTIAKLEGDADINLGDFEIF